MSTQRARKSFPARALPSQNIEIARKARQLEDVQKVRKTVRAKISEKRRQPIRTPAMLASQAAKQALGILPPPKPAEAPPLVLPGENFWLNIVKDVVISEEEKGEALDAIQKLAFFDSIHDFWPERGKKKKPAEGEAEEPPVKISIGEDGSEPIELDPKERMNTVHEKLVESIRKYLVVEGPAGIREILQGTTKDLVTSPNGIEDNVLAYFSKTYSPFNQIETNITVKDILEKWTFAGNFGSSWEAYRAAILKLPEYITILIEGTFIKSLDTTQLGHVGFFILAYMNPNVNPGQSNVNLTFDMLPGDVGRIFERFSQVRNGIYPQNVADSAVTSFTALLGRTQFFRADYTASGKGGVIQQVARSNAFTRDKYNIVFVDTGFGPKNRFGFYVDIRDKATNEVLVTIPFGNGKEQGPSVNYLMDLLYTNSPEAAVKNLKMDKVATFSGLKDIDPDLLFDIKRLGDQEQMLVTTSYGITGDRFAGAFRRLLRMPGIYHSTKGLRVWRGRTGAPEPDVVKQAREFRKAKVIEKLKLVSGILKADAVRDELLRMKNQVSEAVLKGTVFYVEDGFRYKGRLTPEFMYENYTRIAERFATYLLRARMQDIAVHIESLIAKVEAFRANIPEYDAAACVIEQPKPSKPEEPCPPQAPPSDDIVDSALNKLEEFLEGVDELKKMNIAFVSVKTDAGEIDGVVEPIYVQLFDESNRLIKGATSSLFNFSAGAFHNSDTGLAVTVAKLLQVASSTYNVDTVAPQINKFLAQYFQARDDIKEAFLNDEMKDSVESITDITSGPEMTPVRIVTVGNDGKQGFLDVLNRLASEFEVGAVVGPAPEPVARVVGGAGVGPVGSPLQYRDLHDLFAKICMEAELVIDRLKHKYDGALDEAYEVAVQVANQAGVEASAQGQDAYAAAETAANAYMTEADGLANTAYIIEAASAVTELETKWVTEVEQIRVHAEDDYGAQYEDSSATDLVTFLLSFRTMEGGGVDHDAIFRIGDAEVVRRRDIPRFEDIRIKLLQTVPVEPFLLEILSTMGTEILTLANANTSTEVGADKISGTYAARAKWRDDLPRALYVATAPGAEAIGLVRGGGLEEVKLTIPNAPDNATGSSRRNLYAGLRKRGGSGTPPELRE